MYYTNWIIILRLSSRTFSHLFEYQCICQFMYA